MSPDGIGREGALNAGVALGASGAAGVAKYRFWSSLVRCEMSAQEFASLLQMDVQAIRTWCGAEVPSRYESLVRSVLRDKPMRHYADCRIPVEQRFVIAVSDDRDRADEITRRRRWFETPDCGLEFSAAMNFRAFGFGTTYQTRNAEGGFDLNFRFLPGHAARFCAPALR